MDTLLWIALMVVAAVVVVGGWMVIEGYADSRYAKRVARRTKA